MKSAKHQIWLVPAVLGGLWSSLPAAGEEPSVTVTGGLQPDGSFYRWDVCNHASSPVVSIEIPHYGADMFVPPKGWKSKAKLRSDPSTENEPWTCRAFVELPRDGIPRGGKVSVSMRVLQLEARQGRGTVKVGLADGTVLEIANVEVPCIPGYFERFGYLITLAIIIGFVALIAARRRHRQQAAEALVAASEPEAAESGPSPPQDRT